MSNPETNIFQRLFGIESIRLSQKEKIRFFDDLYNLIHAWIPITNSLSILWAQSKNRKMKKIISTLLKEINTGKKFRDCCARFPKIFDTFSLSMIEMWEVTGKVDNALETIKSREEKSQELKSKIIWALIYPIIVIFLAIGMIVGFLVYVIPTITKMYQDARVALPKLTQIIIDASEFLQDYYIQIGWWLWGFIVFFTIFKKSKYTKILYDYLILKIPIFGPLFQKRILVTFSHTLGILLQSGVIINKSLAITKSSLWNAYYEKRIDKISQQIAKGLPLSDALGIQLLRQSKQDPHFPLELSSIVKIWEQTGNLPPLLLRISQKFNTEIENITKGLSTAIEPIVIIVVGWVIGTLVVAIILPFFNMAQII